MRMPQQIVFGSAKDLANIKHQEGLVLLGCGEPHMEWVDGIEKHLHDNGILPKDQKFDNNYLLITTGGRNDIVLMFPKKIDVGRLAMWRLQFGSCCWLSDYVVNYATQHGERPMPGDGLYPFDDL